MLKVQSLFLKLLFIPVLLTATISVTIASSNCPTEMISYWKMEEDSSAFGFEGFVDEMGSLVNGQCAATCPNNVEEGLVNNCQYFNGINNGIWISEITKYDWDAFSSFSMEVWIKREQGISSMEIILGRDDLVNQMQWFIGIQATGNAVFSLTTTDGTGKIISGTKDLDNDLWHHIVAVRDFSANKIRLYVDGHLENESVFVSYGAGFNSNEPVTVGYLNENGDSKYHFLGLIDEMSLYKRVLKEEEIRSHYYLSKGYCELFDTDIRIMPLGDSITYDSYGNGDTRGLSERTSYRQALWLSLEQNDYFTDFIGSEIAGQGAVPFFDHDNAGFPGIEDGELAYLLQTGFNQHTSEEVTDGPYLDFFPAEVILLHIGTNNLAVDPSEVEDILDEIDNTDEKITVVLPRIIRKVGEDPDNGLTHQFNDAVQTMAEARIESGDKIIIVDMEDGAGIEYLVGADMYDTIHPNEAGYEKMAAVWFDSLEQFLPQYSPPVVLDIPDQTIEEGALFSSINLDDFVDDPNHFDSEISWNFSGNIELSVEISNRVATITIPDENWNGTETITFKATDLSGLFDETVSNYTVTSVNDSPLIQGASELETMKNEDFTISFEDLTVTDVDNSYPEQFFMTVYDGANYQVNQNDPSGQPIKPALNYVGELYVPISVNDGLAESNIINMVIRVVDDDNNGSNGSESPNKSDTSLSCFINNLLN